MEFSPNTRSACGLFFSAIILFARSPALNLHYLDIISFCSRLFLQPCVSAVGTGVGVNDQLLALVHVSASWPLPYPPQPQYRLPLLFSQLPPVPAAVVSVVVFFVPDPQAASDSTIAPDNPSAAIFFKFFIMLLLFFI